MPRSDKLHDRLTELARLVRMQAQLLAIGGVIACLFVPIASVTAEGRDGGPGPTERIGFFTLLDSMNDFDEGSAELVETYPNAVPVGLTMAWIGLALLVIGLLLAAWVVTRFDEVTPRPVLQVRLALAVLPVAAFVLFCGLVIFPEYTDSLLGDLEVGPSWGLWLPIVVTPLVGTWHARFADLGQELAET